jgi:hypothetical protein
VTTNQEGLHATVRALTSTARSYNEDWHALFDDDGIAAGPFDSRMLAWINAALSTSRRKRHRRRLHPTQQRPTERVAEL